MTNYRNGEISSCQGLEVGLEGWKRGECGYKSTEGILVVIELFHILIMVVGT